MKRIREVRNSGLSHAGSARDWVQAITGTDPGELRTEYTISEEK